MDEYTRLNTEIAKLIVASNFFNWQDNKMYADFHEFSVVVSYCFDNQANVLWFSELYAGENFYYKLDICDNNYNEIQKKILEKLPHKIEAIRQSVIHQNECKRNSMKEKIGKILED